VKNPLNFLTIYSTFMVRGSSSHDKKGYYFVVADNGFRAKN